VTTPTEQVPSAPTDEPDDVIRPSASSGTRSDSSKAERAPSSWTPKHSRSSRWWRIGFPIALIALIVLIPVLVWVGVKVVLGSNEGRIVRTVTDPSAPGWEATVDPTPVHALALVNEQGQLDSVAVLSLTGEGSGSVVVLSSATVMGVPGIGQVPLSLVHGNGGAELVREGVQGILGAGIPAIDVVEPTEWADLVGPVGSVQVSNPDPVSVVGASGQEVVFPKGSIDVAASQVWAYLSTRNAGENDLNRLVRVEAFWRAWVSALAAAGDRPGIVPGETESGIGMFVRGFAAGQFDAMSLPVRETPIPFSEGVVYEPQLPEVHEMVARIVPFPAGPEGTRARVAVLDGTGSLDHGLGAAVVVAATGGQVDKVGNADEFGVPTTQLVYYDDAVLTRVQRMRDALGVGEIVKSDELNAALDVTIVLGQDYVLAQPEGSVPAASLAPAGGGG
jgi:hypothetical protein